MPDSRRGTIGAVWSHRRPVLNGAKTGPAHRPYFWGGFGGWNAPIPGGVWGLVRQGNPWGGRGGGAGGGILAAVVAAWPGSPEAIRAGILALVRTSVGED